MKTKYRIIESRYSDGSVRFFPQSGDWWHGWRFFAQKQWNEWNNAGWPGIRIWFYKFEDAAHWLEKEIGLKRTLGDGAHDIGYIQCVEQIKHNVVAEEKEVN